MQRLRERRPLDGLGLGSVGGRIDLRNVPLPASLQQLEGVTLRGLDFSHAMVANLRLVDSEVIDCRFDGADCQYWRPAAAAVSGATSAARSNAMVSVC